MKCVIRDHFSENPNNSLCIMLPDSKRVVHSFKSTLPLTVSEVFAYYYVV